MKYIIVIPSWSYRGGERIFLNLAEALAKSGEEVIVVAGRKDQKLAIPVSNKIQVVYPYRANRLVQNDWISFFFGSVFIAYELYKVSKNADWIISESNNCLLASTFVSLFTKSKVAWYVMAYEKTHFQNPILNITWSSTFGFLERISVKRVSSFFALADRVGDTIRDRFRKESIVLNPIIKIRKPRILRVEKQLKKLYANKTILFLPGALHWKKNQALAIKVLSKLSKNYSYVHLIIAGEGKEEENLRKLAQKLKVTNRTHFVGVLKDDNLIYAYANATATLVCSINDNEGLSLTSLEAIVLGSTPVVSSEAGVARLLKRENLGFVVPPTVSAFVTVIRKIIIKKIKPSKREKIYIQKNFSEKAVINTLLLDLSKKA